MKFEITAAGFELSQGGIPLLVHEPAAPCLFIGHGVPSIETYRGNFKIEDYVSERFALRHVSVRQDGAANILDFAADAMGAVQLSLALTITGGHATLRLKQHDARINRVWLRLPARAGEHVWGGGEQMSYFDMRGRRFPLFTSEPGVGRDKTSEITFKADVTGKSGGDYYNTNYPQPTYISSDRYAFHMETTAYCAFDFRHADFHEAEIWAVPEAFEFFTAPHFTDLVSSLSNRFGRPPALPDWVHDGAILGLKQGMQSFERMEGFIAAGAKIAGLWCEDWCGVRETSFGTRLFWDWRANDKRYPNLQAHIKQLAERGIRFLGYVNPYLAVDGTQYPEAAAKDYLVRDQSGGIYQVDFGEFDCGIVDFTKPDACEWFAEHVIGTQMLGIGMAGWMADFGEYLPVDAVLANGQSALEAHNLWPVLWAKVNADALTMAGKEAETLFFMRAGFSGFQRYNRLLWAGDQCVDFSRHDGLQTVICGALSSGLLGNPYHHSDIGGYTSLFGNVRTAELLMRWSEMAAFTPVMRSHEGNRPRDNLQLDQDAQVLAHFAAMTEVFAKLAPYRRAIAQQAVETGLPMQRPMFLHFEDDQNSYTNQTQYLLGPDLLVAPVIAANVSEMEVYLPAPAEWTHLWSGQSFAGGQTVTVAAPLGQPPVFTRSGSAFAGLFETLRNEAEHGVGSHL
jgi:alpha-glucosidase